MIKDVLHKHAALGLNNGAMIEGFVQESDEKYFKVVEWDNNIAIVRIDDISFARLTSGGTQPAEPPGRYYRYAPDSSGVQKPQAVTDSGCRPAMERQIVEPQEMRVPGPPPQPEFQLDEEGFAVGLPRGTTTTEFPFKAPITGKEVYEQPFVRGKR